MRWVARLLTAMAASARVAQKTKAQSRGWVDEGSHLNSAALVQRFFHLDLYPTPANGRMKHVKIRPQQTTSTNLILSVGLLFELSRYSNGAEMLLHLSMQN